MRGVVGTGVVPVEMRCRGCKRRYRQHADGLCRTCHRADRLGPDVQALTTLGVFVASARHHYFLMPESPQRLEGLRQAVAAMNAIDLLAENISRLRHPERERAK